MRLTNSQKKNQNKNLPVILTSQKLANIEDSILNSQECLTERSEEAVVPFDKAAMIERSKQSYITFPDKRKYHSQ